MADQDPSDARIRELGLTSYGVYNTLHWELGSAEKVLEKYPGLTNDDLAAAEAYVVDRIRARTHDEISGRRILPKALLKHGVYYKGRCGNATIARWNAEETRFYHWREKFGNI